MEELSVISLTYEVHKKLIDLNTVVDKKYRHSLSEPTVATCQEVMRQLILAKHAPKSSKSSYLIKAGSYAEVLSQQLRIALEMKLANDTNLLKLQAKISEIRKQIGGWRKSVPL